MNIKVCERCCNGINYWEIFKSIQKLPLLKISYTNEKATCYIGTCTVYVSGSNDKIEELEEQGFEKLELADNRCPYWLEHQIYDWNKR